MKRNISLASYMVDVAPKLSQLILEVYVDKLKELVSNAVGYHAQA
jgi:hypothetical protein